MAADEVNTAIITHRSTYGATTGATLTSKITKKKYFCRNIVGKKNIS